MAKTMTSGRRVRGEAAVGEPAVWGLGAEGEAEVEDVVAVFMGSGFLRDNREIRGRFADNLILSRRGRGDKVICRWACAQRMRFRRGFGRLFCFNSPIGRLVFPGKTRW